MKTTNEAYSLIDEKLTRIEQSAVSGVLDGDARRACLDIKTLVYETRQVLRDNFIDDDGPEVKNEIQRN